MKLVVIAGLSLIIAGAHAQMDVQSVSIDENRALRLNGEPFFPIMIWLQDPSNFDRAREAGINTIAGYWPGSGDTEDVAEYIETVQDAGFLGVMPWDERLIGHPALLGFIHDDEPDLPHLESAATVVPAEHMRVNPDTPLWRIVDGITSSWSVLDPMEGAKITIELDEPVTIERIAIWLTISEGLSVAREVVLSADGREITRATLENRRGRQEIDPGGPVTLESLTLTVESAYPGENVWGSISEIEGLNADGENVLLSPPVNVPRQQPEQTLAKYRTIKAAGADRPVFMTVTAQFMPNFDKYSEERKQQLYPAYMQATDIVGFDVYPIYGWGRPEWLHLVHDGTERLVQIADGRPVYAWIETSAGSQWVSEQNQVPVRPEHIRNEVWQAITAGATIIGYFTHVWKPEYAQFGVPDGNVAMMREVNDQITRLTPALLSPESGREVSIDLGELRADVLAKQAEDGLYLFAINFDPSESAGTATIRVEGLAAGTEIEVVDEERTLIADDEGFTDEFAPLAVHIYRIPKL